MLSGPARLVRGIHLLFTTPEDAPRQAPGSVHPCGSVVQAGMCMRRQAHAKDPKALMAASVVVDDDQRRRLHIDAFDVDVHGMVGTSDQPARFTHRMPALGFFPSA